MHQNLYTHTFCKSRKWAFWSLTCFFNFSWAKVACLLRSASPILFYVFFCTFFTIFCICFSCWSHFINRYLPIYKMTPTRKTNLKRLLQTVFWKGFSNDHSNYFITQKHWIYFSNISKLKLKLFHCQNKYFFQKQ